MNTIVFLCLMAVSSTYCWVGIVEYSAKEFASNHIDSEDAHCFTTMGGLGPMQTGQTKQLNDSCATGTCSNNRWIYITGCGVVKVDPPCYLKPGNLSKPYPKCCFEVECRQVNSAEIANNNL